MGLGAEADFASVVSMADLTTASQPMVDEMKKSYEKGVSDNISEGYGQPVQEDLANAQARLSEVTNTSMGMVKGKPPESVTALPKDRLRKAEMRQKDTIALYLPHMILQNSKL